jgi:phospholipid/cholesterol/gamma-HCH transport system substrate-binding protein
MDRRWLELGVGFFLLIGLACLAYLSLKLGDVSLWGDSNYPVQARFSNVAGLKVNAQVSMAGVNIGKVTGIRLQDGQAWVTLSINADVRLEEDTVAAIKTMGIIGDKYVTVTPGASDLFIKPGGIIRDTEPPLDIESLLGRFVFGSMEKAEPKSE